VSKKEVPIYLYEQRSDDDSQTDRIIRVALVVDEINENRN